MFSNLASEVCTVIEELGDVGELAADSVAELVVAVDVVALIVFGVPFGIVVPLGEVAGQVVEVEYGIALTHLTKKGPTEVLEEIANGLEGFFDPRLWNFAEPHPSTVEWKFVLGFF